MIHLNSLHTALLYSQLSKNLLSARLPLLRHLPPSCINLVFNLLLELLALGQFVVLCQHCRIDFLLVRCENQLSIFCLFVKRISNVQIILIAFLRDLKKLLLLCLVHIELLLQLIELDIHEIGHMVLRIVHVLKPFAYFLDLIHVIVDGIF